MTNRPAVQLIREALLKARTNIQDENNIYLCYALDDVANSHHRLNKACEYVRSYVRQQLDGFAFLEDWQDNRRATAEPNRLFLMSKNRPVHARRQDRINWINWMLKELV